MIRLSFGANGLLIMIDLTDIFVHRVNNIEISEPFGLQEHASFERFLRVNLLSTACLSTRLSKALHGAQELASIP